MQLRDKNGRFLSNPQPAQCEHEPKYCKGLCKSCYFRLWRQNPEHVRKQADRSREWYLAHRDRTLAEQRERYARDPATIQKARQKYIEAHRQDAVARAKAWKLANPERSRGLNNHKERNRRARTNGSVGSFTLAEWETLKQQLGYRCVGCWRTETELKAVGLLLSPDHIVSLAKGGSNDITNIQPLCHSRKKGVRGGCNQKKHARYQDFLIS